MTTRPLSLLLILLFVAPGALAQKDDHPHDRRAESVVHHANAPDAPAGLSPSEVADLRAGRGMGLARAAELNHYPGPKHVLELADDLGLTREQRTTAERLTVDVQAEASALGEQLLEREHHLDRLFDEGSATPDMVDRITAHIAETQAALRAVHLRAHIAMRDALTADQIATYDRLRGYTD